MTKNLECDFERKHEHLTHILISIMRTNKILSRHSPQMFSFLKIIEKRGQSPLRCTQQLSNYALILLYGALFALVIGTNGVNVRGIHRSKVHVDR